MNRFKLTLHQGEILLARLLKDGVDIPHDCGGVLACSSCRVVLREGLGNVGAASERELDMLDRTGDAAPGERLACQVRGAGELLLELSEGAVPVHAALLPVSMSERAAKHFAAQLAKFPGAIALRLTAEAGGCSGFRHRVDPARSLRSGDRAFESHGVRIVVDKASLPYVQGTELDVVQNGLGRRVLFVNPNALRSCGCGESFGA